MRKIYRFLMKGGWFNPLQNEDQVGHGLISLLDML